ncbi:Sensor histidine kinase TodS [Caloramator mitchellensis]|uniref:histidine kinase n=1 Tax=Caloramator mitchellensis TaxID=908809 RepID=A0A0R3JWB9_CALMK|nr:sensor histidine kinase [Caloramator mitchellensis]KRQ87849.1 Sensor histidine kinase TodS [Caloramator mitchellensis]
MDRTANKLIVKTLFVSIFFTIVFAVLIFIASYTVTKQIILRIINDYTFSQLQNTSRFIEVWIEERKNELTLISELPHSKQLEYEKIIPYFERQIKTSFSLYDYLFLSDSEGNVFGTGNFSVENIKNTKIFNRVMNGERVVLCDKLGTDNKIRCIVAAPIYNQENKITGIIAGVLKINAFKELIAELKIDYKQSYSYIVDENGLALSHPNENFILNEYITNPNHVINRDNPKNGEYIINNKKGFVEYSYLGVPTYAYFCKINDSNWTLITKIPKGYINENIKIKEKFLFIMIIIIIILVGALTYVVSLIVLNKFYSVKVQIDEKERQLKESIELDKIKSEFFANVSHEFKTPLNIIFSSAQLLEKQIENYEPSIRENSLKYIKMIKQNSYRLNRFINNLLDVSKLESGLVDVSLQKVNIVEVIEDITNSVIEYAKINNKEVIFDTNTEEKFILIDVDKLERVLLNLLSNAIKYTRDGDSIEVVLYDLGNIVEIKVKDTGIGIPKDKLEEIFEKFKQVEPIFRRTREGSGLGLFIVKSLVNIMGGEIIVSSEFGIGSEFIVKLPVVEDTTQNVGINNNELITADKITTEFSNIN